MSAFFCVINELLVNFFFFNIIKWCDNIHSFSIILLYALNFFIHIIINANVALHSFEFLIENFCFWDTKQKI